ncbi:cell wall glucanase (Scw11), putative [Cordyceps militaris CM01]|uniref:Probable beta-glucosidase btgE n=1 Tax=Cordyceps militaris (strain CM01) TaxID=983644 RepID=G3JLF3_CORMM|nr:cell wall glucanase (Scw11), putative [Cordyceps militaris CM01]EGX90527.1 cell wall glucanase (Scw11), putative [Cordyceps militaris CM01]
MKATFFAAAAAMAGAASANNHRHAHQKFAKRGHAASTGFPIAATGEVCLPGCTTIWKTITGEATLVPVTVTTVTSTSTNTSTVTITPSPTSVSVPVQTKTVVVVPTPEVQRCPTPGTYTFPATTMTVTDTTTVCGATTTKVPAGTHTVGGVTTVVTTLTTVTCPVATVVTNGGVATSTISLTEYVCPTAGTYTIGAHTTAIATETVIVYPTPTVIAPGTYTKPEVVVTATVTDYVTVCPFTSSGLPTATPTPVAISTPVPAPAVSTATPVPAAPSSVAPSSVAPSSAAPSASAPAAPGTSKTEVKGTNDHFAITYGPYDSATGNCKSGDQVKKDISQIKAAGFQAVRIYGTDCDTLVNVVPACVSQGLQIIAGVFVKPGQQCSINTPEVKKQVDDLVAMNNWDAIRLLVVSNESIMNGICSASELVQLIKDVKAQCSGYQGPVTIAETLNIWQRQDVADSLCPLVDVVGANIHAFFNPNVDASGAGVFVKGQMDILQGICGKNVINLETGWKNDGACNGKACPGAADQSKAISSIRKTCGDASVFFSFDNEGWKPQADQRWGLGAIFNFSQ